jgi:hypothetical protein
MKQLFFFSFIILCKISFAQNVGINITTPQAALDVYGDVIFRSADLVVANGTTLALDVNGNRFSFYRVAGPSAGFTIAGLTQGVEGRLVTLFNRSGFAMQVNNLDAAAVVNNRIITGANADITIADKGVVNLMFDGAEQKWVVLSNNKPASVGNSSFYGSPINYGLIGSSYLFSGGAILLGHQASATVSNLLAIDGNNIQAFYSDAGLQDEYPNPMSLNALGGNLGIGTNTALSNAKVTVETDANFSTGLLIRNPSNSIEFKTYLGGPANGNAVSLGTTGNNPIAIYTNSANRMYISGNGNIGIGTDNPDAAYLLSVNGKIKAKEIRVTTANWADYVFAKDYKLMPLKEVEAYINTNKHLPNISAASEIEKNGLDISAMQSKMMEKIEELTLYLIEANKKIETLERKLDKK